MLLLHVVTVHMCNAEELQFLDRSGKRDPGIADCANEYRHGVGSSRQGYQVNGAQKSVHRA